MKLEIDLKGVFSPYMDVDEDDNEASWDVRSLGKIIEETILTACADEIKSQIMPMTKQETFNYIKSMINEEAKNYINNQIKNMFENGSIQYGSGGMKVSEVIRIKFKEVVIGNFQNGASGSKEFLDAVMKTREEIQQELTSDYSELQLRHL